MDKISFKKEYRHGLYSSLNISKPYSDTTIPTIAIEKELYSYQFHYYIALAQFLVEHLSKYVILKTSPYLVSQSFVKSIGKAEWKYLVLANDYYGLGVDKDFINVERNADEQQELFSIESLLSLENLPEDTYGDEASQISILGLTENRAAGLLKFIQSDTQPVLAHFLKKGELFIHIISSKSIGYYHSMLIKSVDDIEQHINAFQNVIAPDN